MAVCLHPACKTNFRPCFTGRPPRGGVLAFGGAAPPMICCYRLSHRASQPCSHILARAPASGAGRLAAVPVRPTSRSERPPRGSASPAYAPSSRQIAPLTVTTRLPAWRPLLRSRPAGNTNCAELVQILHNLSTVFPTGLGASAPSEACPAACSRVNAVMNKRTLTFTWHSALAAVVIGLPGDQRAGSRLGKRRGPFALAPRVHT
jgi:hypothetical protein